jgi:hypothetical protein
MHSIRSDGEQPVAHGGDGCTEVPVVSGSPRPGNLRPLRGH